jgi:ketosteroid isomerase-like protein
MSQENVEVVRRAVAGWNRGDVDAWMEAAHPEVEWSSGVQRLVEGTQTVWRGRDEVRRFWDEWHALWDLSIQISEFRNIGDTIVALGQMQIRGKASGIDLDQSVAYVVEFDSGLIRKMSAYLDEVEALQAVGLSE